MLDQLSPQLSSALTPLFEQMPISQAMPRLVESSDAGESPLRPLVSQIIEQTIACKYPALAAALWLYVDELDISHQISQGMDNPTGSYWHGIMHRREGDFPNSHYWFRRTGHHPAMELVDGGYAPQEFVDQVAVSVQEGQTPETLVELQRREWMTLFIWCAQDQGV